MAARLASGRTNVVAATLGLLMVGGVYLDGWAHLNRPGLESFFTLWHAVLYGGFTLLACYVAWVGLRRGGRLGLRWSPPYGYGLAGVGVLTFVAGGLGDMAWHEVLGVEVGVDALVSPTHLVLLVGGMLMITVPMRAARSDLGVAALVATALSVAATAALAGFFLSYLSVFADAAPASAVTIVPEGAPGHREGELAAVAGLGAYLASTTAFLVPLLALPRLRGSVPAGSVTAAVAAVALLGALPTGFRYVVPAVVATLAAALVEVSSGWWPARVDRWVVLALVLPLAVWSGQLTGLAVTEGVAWPVQLWAGVVVLTGLAGLALGLLTAGNSRTSATAPAATGGHP